MKNHTVEIKELSNLFGASIEISSCSRAADTADITFRLNDIDSASPWGFGDEVTLTENGSVVFHGYVTEEPDISIDTSGITCRITLSNIVALMDAVPYIEPQSFDGLVKNEARLVSASDIISSLLSHGMVLPNGEAASEAYETINLGHMVICPTGSGSQSCWSLVNSCLHWVPNAVSWYNPETRLLSFRTADQGETLTLDLKAGQMRKGGQILFSFEGFSEANFKPRHDLCPPAVGLIWQGYNKTKIYADEGATLRQPWAFCFQVPERVGSPMNEPMPPEEARRAQLATQKTMTVQGYKVPDGWANEADMKSPADGAPKLWHDFWCHYSAMDPLKKTNVSCLSFGAAVFEPVSKDEAFPKETELDGQENEQPDNYEEFSAGKGAIYALYEGQFPASSKKRDNVKDLKFCKGKLKQYVFVTDSYVGTLSQEEWQEFFSGSANVTINGQKGKARYALLELEGVFINRRKKKYQEGTNKLDKSDIDFSPENEETENNDYEWGGATDAEYEKAAADFYAATRKLYYDGSISLRGVSGYNPAQLAGANVDIIGARNEWVGMNSPVVRADWNPQFKMLTISTGSPEILTIDERLERMMIGRQTNYGAGTSFANPPSATQEKPGEDGSEETTNSRSFPMVSPSISASVSVTKSGRTLNPFEMYSTGSGESKKWYLNEGVLVAPGGRFVNFETTEITEIVNEFPNDKISVRAERKKGTNEWEAVVRHFSPPKKQ